MRNLRKKIKLLFVGPKRAGKSTLLDFLIDPSSDNDISFKTEYNPTVGCRIFEMPLPNCDKVVEIWDCSGDQNYDVCWSAFIQGITDTNSITTKVDAVCICYRQGDGLDEIKWWYDYFVRKQGISDYRCLVLAMDDMDVRKLKTNDIKLSHPNFLRGCPFHHVSNESLETARQHFRDFIRTIEVDVGVI